MTNNAFVYADISGRFNPCFSGSYIMTSFRSVETGL